MLPSTYSPKNAPNELKYKHSDRVGQMQADQQMGLVPLSSNHLEFTLSKFARFHKNVKNSFRAVIVIFTFPGKIVAKLSPSWQVQFEL